MRKEPGSALWAFYSRESSPPGRPGGRPGCGAGVVPFCRAWHLGSEAGSLARCTASLRRKWQRGERGSGAGPPPAARAPGLPALSCREAQDLYGKTVRFGGADTSRRALPGKRVPLLLRCTPRDAGLAERCRVRLEGREAAAGEGGPGGPRWSPVVPGAGDRRCPATCPLPDSPRSVHVRGSC